MGGFDCGKILPRLPGDWDTPKNAPKRGGKDQAGRETELLIVRAEGRKKEKGRNRVYLFVADFIPKRFPG